jgi:membrane associated rhomboid family serine protease
MGIYDREYYRKDGPSFLGTLARRGSVWRWLIAVNVVAFVIQLATAQHRINGWFTDLFQLDTDAVLNGQVWRLLTAAFLHSFDWQHIVFNMLFLWWAGSEVEDIYGPREFLAFYLVAAVVSSLAFVLWQVVAVPRGDWRPMIGASGAVTAVLVLFAMHFPTRVVYLFFFFPVPVIVLVVLNVLQDTLGLLGGNREPVAFACHLGGAAFGFAYYKLHWRVMNLWPSGWHFRPGRPRPKLRVYRGESESGTEAVPVTPAPQRPLPDSQLEAELDDVLAKVARLGKSSLTEREQQILLRASEVYRNRRK